MSNLTKLFPPLLFTLLMLAGCGGGQEKSADGKAGGSPGGGMPPPEVEVVTVATGAATITQDSPGHLQAYRTAQVRARVEGVVEKRLFREGSDVTAGMPLFRIDARSYRATALAAQAEALNAAQTEARYQSLLAIKAVSQQEFDAAQVRHKQAEAAKILAEEHLQYASVPAPIAGRIGRALVTEGALVGKGEATLLATIEQLDPIYANFTQSGADMLKLRQASKTGKWKRSQSAKVELLLEDGSVYPLPGKLFFADMAVDAATGAVSLRAEFPNPQRELLPGMFVRVRFPQAEADNVIRIPQRAVQAGTDGQFVMVVGADGKVMPKPVVTADMAGGDFIISKGLEVGERVIVNGLQKARPGAEVKPVPPGESPSAPPTTKP